MRRSYAIAVASVVVATGVAIPAAAAVEEATSSEVTFRLYIADGGTYALESAADLAAWPVMWRTGDTVTAKAMDGTVRALATDASAAGSAALPQGGGVWTLESALSGSATVGVPWSVFNDGGDLATTGEAASGKVDTWQTGPDRRTDRRSALPVAYSGDNWAGDVSKAATVTFTPPEESGLSQTVWSRTGSGADSFVFDKPGRWTVTLAFADGTTRTAEIDVVSAGLVIYFR